jgi:hypothetical protein
VEIIGSETFGDDNSIGETDFKIIYSNISVEDWE